MAKRQVRLKHQNLTERLPEFYGQKVHIIRKNGSVIFLRLEEIRDDSLTGRNMRLNKLFIPVKEIEEVIIDIDS